MKRLFVSAVALLLATAAVQAQSDTTKAPHHQMQKDGAYKQLNLSAEQQAKLKAARESFRQKRDALSAQKLTEAERRTQLQALRQQQRTELEAILTPEQKEQLSKLRTEHKAQPGAGKRRHHDEGLANRNGAMLRELNLTTEQQAKIKDIRTGFRSKADSLRSDQALTDAQRREKLHELHQQQQEQLRTVLTKEQQEKLQSLRNERAGRNTR